LIVIALTSCEEQSSIGVEVLPAGDLISVRSTTQKNMKSLAERLFNNGMPYTRNHNQIWAGQ